MRNKHHLVLLKLIQKHAGQPTAHTFLDSYLGNNHPRYPINAPTLRKLAKDWMRAHDQLGPTEFSTLLTSLVRGKSSTEKCLVGILLDYATSAQRKFNPRIFNHWLDHLVGWAEVDSVCTGKYTIAEIPPNMMVWKKLLNQLSKSRNLNKRRASLVFLCSPLRRIEDDALAQTAFTLIDRLKHEKDIMITKAISWLLRSMYKHHKTLLTAYLDENEETLPRIAVRETRTKLNTGTKTRRNMHA